MAGREWERREREEGAVCREVWQEQEAVLGEGAVCGGCRAPPGEPPTRRGCRETCIPRALDAAGRAGMLPPGLAAGEGASASLSPSITAADAARLDHVVRQQPAWFCPASGVRGGGPGLSVWLISRKESLPPSQASL